MNKLAAFSIAALAWIAIMTTAVVWTCSQDGAPLPDMFKEEITK